MYLPDIQTTDKAVNIWLSPVFGKEFVEDDHWESWGTLALGPDSLTIRD